MNYQHKDRHNHHRTLITDSCKTAVMATFTPLENLLAAPRDGAQPVFLSPQLEIIEWQHWQSRVLQWRELLQRQTGQRWALYHPCAAEFSACLFALLSLGKTVCLPGNRQPEFIKRLSTRVDGFAGDFEPPVPSLSRSGTTLTTATPDALAPLRLNTHEPLIEVFTSGSSGEPQAIAKSLGQLSAEVQHLHQLWGGDLGTALVVGTVSHQHIYGLLFRVLWPLAAGWCSDTHACEYLEELALRHSPLPRAATPPRLLVSSPTHLPRVPAALDAAVSRDLTAIFSSGAPLQRASSLHAKTRLGAGVREVFGSSETGGIAWREQHDPAADAPWQPLPGVEVRLAADAAADGETYCLEVRSGHLTDAHHWYRTSDRVRFDPQGHFTLLGRADRIVKVEGKRVSLDEMEQQLLRHPGVEQARVLQLEPQALTDEKYSRAELAAVVVLSAEGAGQLSTAGKRVINQQLKDHLIGYFERPTVPRKWRYVDALPVNSQGKLQHQTLRQLFDKTDIALPSRRPALPKVLGITHIAEGQRQMQLHIPADLLYFDGHFDQAPILPGVVQIHWAEHFARELFAVQGEFAAMEVIKFQKVIVPDTEVTLELAYDTGKHKITFAYHSPAAQHSSGRIVLSTAS